MLSKLRIAPRSHPPTSSSAPDTADAARECAHTDGLLTIGSSCIDGDLLAERLLCCGLERSATETSQATTSVTTDKERIDALKPHLLAGIPVLGLRDADEHIAQHRNGAFVLASIISPPRLDTLGVAESALVSSVSTCINGGSGPGGKKSASEEALIHEQLCCILALPAEPPLVPRQPSHPGRSDLLRWEQIGEAVVLL